MDATGGGLKTASVSWGQWSGTEGGARMCLESGESATCIFPVLGSTVTSSVPTSSPQSSSSPSPASASSQAGKFKRWVYVFSAVRKGLSLSPFLFMKCRNGLDIIIRLCVLLHFTQDGIDHHLTRGCSSSLYVWRRNGVS